MKNGLAIGASGSLSWSVTAETAIHLGAEQTSGVAVLATPSMINLMEHAARHVLRDFLEPEEESVGVSVSVEHLAATPIGAQVTAQAVVTGIKGKLIDFEITARDDQDVIGRGIHRRAVISLPRFAAHLQEKSQTMDHSPLPPDVPIVENGPVPSLETLDVRVDGAVAQVTLNRPKKLNAVNKQMTSDWETLNRWLANHPEVRIVVLAGAGDAFCAGDDIPEVGTLSPDAARHLSYRQAGMYLAWERLPQVFIAAVHGAAMGGGCVAAYSCDFRIAASDARFGMPEIRLGWTPGYGLAQLTAIVGKPRALELCLTGKTISAQQARDYGLVHDVVPGNRLMPAVEELAQTLLEQPKVALRETKRAIHKDEGLGPKMAYLVDTAAYIRCLQTDHAREGIAAFREKRPPRYQ